MQHVLDFRVAIFCSSGIKNKPRLTNTSSAPSFFMRVNFMEKNSPNKRVTKCITKGECRSESEETGENRTEPKTMATNKEIKLSQNISPLERVQNALETVTSSTASHNMEHSTNVARASFEIYCAGKKERE